jgi:hypothetical protein
MLAELQNWGLGRILDLDRDPHCLIVPRGATIKSGEHGITHLFPAPDVIAEVSLDDFGIIGTL